MGGNIGGYSIEELNSMNYSMHDNLDNDDFLRTEVSCDYVVTDNIGANFNRGFSHFLCYNIRSMKQNWASFKVEILDNKNGMSFDLIGLCESHLTDVTENLYPLDHYDLYTVNKSSDKGGVCIYVKENIQSRLRSDLCRSFEYLETVFIECLINNRPVVIGMVYHRPGTSFQQFIDGLSEILENVSSNCILMGDFNLNLLNHQFDNNIGNFMHLLSIFITQSLLSLHGFTIEPLP